MLFTGIQRFFSGVGAHGLRASRSGRLDSFHFMFILIQFFLCLLFVNRLRLERPDGHGRSRSRERRWRLLRWIRRFRRRRIGRMVGSIGFLVHLTDLLV